MTTSPSLFGQNIQDIQKTCVLMPFVTPNLLNQWGLQKLNKGFPYSSGNNDNATLIYTRMGASFVGDAVLLLKESPCERLVFFGACGAVQQTETLRIGSLVLAQQAVALESFSALLRGQFSKDLTASSDPDIVRSFQSANQSESIPLVTCASVGSIALEPQFKQIFTEEQIQVLDLECAAFLHAAEHINRPALALLVVTDIVGKNDPFDRTDGSLQELLSKSYEKAVRLILNGFLSRPN